MQPPTDMSARFVDAGDGIRIATRALAGESPAVLFLGGFRSNMRGTKATALAQVCHARGHAYYCFDYRGHGESDGDFATATVGEWLHDALRVIDAIRVPRLILVGSSMGAWIMLLAALRRASRIAALVGVAAAPDMTERLLWHRFTPAQRRRLSQQGVVHLPSDYDAKPYPIGRQLIEEGRRHLLLHAPVNVQVPVRLLHGLADRDVPWELSQTLLARLESTDASLLLVKHADHRFSDPAHLRRVLDAVEEFFH